MRHALLLCALAVLAPGAAVAQHQPEEAATQFGAALHSEDYAAAARLMHPAALRQLREFFAPMVANAQGAELAKQVFGVESSAAFAAMPDTVLFANFLRTVLNSQPGLGKAMRESKLEILGHVSGQGDTALVVTRTTMSIQGTTLSTFDVMPFAQFEGQYRGLLKADFTNMAAMLKARLGRGS